MPLSVPLVKFTYLLNLLSLHLTLLTLLVMSLLDVFKRLKNDDESGKMDQQCIDRRQLQLIFFVSQRFFHNSVSTWDQDIRHLLQPLSSFS